MVGYRQIWPAVVGYGRLLAAIAGHEWPEGSRAWLWPRSTVHMPYNVDRGSKRAYNVLKPVGYVYREAQTGLNGPEDVRENNPVGRGKGMEKTASKEPKTATNDKKNGPKRVPNGQTGPEWAAGPGPTGVPPRAHGWGPRVPQTIGTKFSPSLKFTTFLAGHGEQLEN